MDSRSKLARIDSQKQAVMQVEGHKLVALAYNIDKGGTPIVFIHGISSSVDYFAPHQIDEIQQHRRWYSLSLPGHYPAVFPDDFNADDLSPQMMARVMSEAVRRLNGGRPVILVGYSTGGYAALCVAAHAPELISGLVIVSGFVQGRWTGILGFSQQVAQLGRFPQRLWAGFGRWLNRTQDSYGKSWLSLTTDKRALKATPLYPITVEQSYPATQHMDTFALMRTYYQRMPHIDITDWLDRIDAPTLVLAGDADGIVPPEQASIIADGINGAESIIYPGAGHLLTLERHTEVERDLSAWLRENTNGKLNDRGKIYGRKGGDDE